MKFTLSWLKNFLDTNATITEIVDTLTAIGLEVESVIDKRKELAEFTVAQIIDTAIHPNANKLRICTVQTQNEQLQIVCGAANARTGIKVVLAPIGCEIPNGKFKIKASEIRGVKSNGMLCSEEELLISNESNGIIELTDDANIGDQFIKYYGLDDPVIHINVTPNRGDALSVYGIARDLAAVGIGALKTIVIPQIDSTIEPSIEVSVIDKTLCELFCIREVQNITNNPSPLWLKRLLKNIDCNSISAIVDITNYIAISFGQPMHAYDRDKISNLEVRVQSHQTQFIALDGQEYTCDTDDLVIANGENIECIAGIIGSSTSGWSENTKNIILEAACFDALSIAKTGQRLQIDTDARYRFERKIDMAFTLNALNIAVEMIVSICGGVPSKAIVCGDSNVNNKSMKFNVEDFEKKIGISLSAEEICAILQKLGFGTNLVGNIIDLQIPSWRHDIAIAEDVIEEVIRIYGYDKINELPLPACNTKSALLSRSKKRELDIKRILAARGYDEVITWSFMHSKIAESFATINDNLRLVHPISSELDYMRPSIIPNLLGIVVDNKARSMQDTAFFEVGPVFLQNDEIMMASGIRCGSFVSQNVHTPSREVNVFDIKTDLAAILEFFELDIENCNIALSKAAHYYHPTRSASISLGKNIIGQFGQLHPSILKMFDIDCVIVGFEINIANIPLGKQKFGKKPECIISVFQSNRRDYAFIIDINQEVGKVISYIKNIDKKLIKSVDLFDIYMSDKIGQDKKSVAISVTIQANDRTLTEMELTTLHNAIILGLKEQFNGIVRGVAND